MTLIFYVHTALLTSKHDTRSEPNSLIKVSATHEQLSAGLLDLEPLDDLLAQEEQRVVTRRVVTRTHQKAVRARCNHTSTVGGERITI